MEICDLVETSEAMAIQKRKKRFFDVDMPIIKKQTQLIAFEPKELAGRIIKYDLTRMLRGKSIMLHLDVKVSGEKPTSIPRKIEIMPYFLKRIVRKGTNYVEDSFSLPCKDSKLKIKPFLVTRRKVSRAVQKTLRENAKEEIRKYAKDKTTDEIFDDVLNNKLQKPLGLTLKKIYPLSFCDIRILEVESRK